jgi:hypothetical protein
MRSIRSPSSQAPQKPVVPFPDRNLMSSWYTEVNENLPHDREARANGKCLTPSEAVQSRAWSAMAAYAALNCAYALPTRPSPNRPWHRFPRQRCWQAMVARPETVAGPSRPGAAQRSSSSPAVVSLLIAMPGMAAAIASAPQVVLQKCSPLVARVAQRRICTEATFGPWRGQGGLGGRWRGPR